MAQDKPDITAVLGVGKPSVWRGRSMVIAVGLGLAAAAYLYWPRAAVQTASAFETAVALRGPLVVMVNATGTVEPTNLVEVSSELSGTVKSVSVNFNDTVTTGQTLALLDTEKLEASLAHSRATLDAKLARVEEAEATLGEAAEQLERMKSLSESRVTSLKSLQAAVAVHARAKAGVAVTKADAKVAEADLRTGETNLAKACICSPIDGVVLSRNVDPGQIVASSLQAPVLFTIAEDLSKMELQAAIDEADMGVISVGKKATFTVEAWPGRTFPAEITQLRFAPQTIDGVVTYQANLSIDNHELLLRPGMTATADILVEQINDALLVPNSAFRYAPPAAPKAGGGGGLLGLIIPRPPASTAPPSAPLADGSRLIYVLKDGLPISVAVKTGASDGQLTAVLSGELKEGDAVITAQPSAK